MPHLSCNLRSIGVLSLLTGVLSCPAQACVDTVALEKLASSELNYMLNRIPPAFADAVADGQVQGRMQLEAADTCQVAWQLTLPAADMQEAQAILQAQPAKQIMLAAQGYEIPTQSPVIAVFAVDEKRMQPQAKEILQTAPLGKVRASVELMYAMLTQARADGPNPQVAWTATDMEQLNAQCVTQFASQQEIAQSCSCRTQEIAGRFSARQVRYNQYLASNPYAFATGNGEAFKQLDKQSQQHCGLTLR